MQEEFEKERGREEKRRQLQRAVLRFFQTLGQLGEQGATLPDDLQPLVAPFPVVEVGARAPAATVESPFRRKGQQ